MGFLGVVRCTGFGECRFWVAGLRLEAPRLGRVWVEVCNSSHSPRTVLHGIGSSEMERTDSAVIVLVVYWNRRKFALAFRKGSCDSNSLRQPISNLVSSQAHQIPERRIQT